MKAITSVIHLLQGRKLGKAKQPGSHQAVVAWDSKAGSTVLCGSIWGPCSKAEFRGYLLLPHVRLGIGITPRPALQGSAVTIFSFSCLCSHLTHLLPTALGKVSPSSWDAWVLSPLPSGLWNCPAEPGQTGTGRGEPELLLPAVHTGFQTRLIPIKKSRAE